MVEPVRIILTGGTIDSYWDGSKDTAVTLEHSALPQFIAGLKLYTPVAFTEVCMKDSRSLDQKDREEILKTVIEAKEKKIIITHGTYTMPDTARYLKSKISGGGVDKTIILTGSMIPLTGFSPSDAPFNLGFVFAKLEDIAPGIYLAMNGQMFDPDEVIKLLAEGRFSSVFAS